MIIEQHEQFKRAIELMENTHHSVFLTGKAGTGKSTLLSHFMNHTKKNVAVLAPTGVAALNVQGETIHSFFGFMPNMTVDKAKKKGAKATKNELYTGVTTNLNGRLQRHNIGRGSVYVWSKGGASLVYVEQHATKGLALRREHEIKSWRREKKLALIRK